MKRNLLAIAIPALLVAGAANASIEIFNKDGNKLSVNGRVYAYNYIGDSANENDTQGDHTNARLGFTGETQITDSLIGYGRAEWQTNAGKDTSTENRYAFAGLKYGQFGSFDYGRNDGVLKTISAYTDVLPEFGGEGNDYLLSDRTSAVATYRNADFFGLVDGLSFALQYGDNDTSADNKLTGNNNKKEAYGLSVEYAILDTGLSAAAGYAQTSGDKDDSKAWSVGLKYDANNLYVAAAYFDQKDKDVAGDNKPKGFEVVAQYGIDFEVGRLTPSVAYIQHQNKENLAAGQGKYTHKYVEVGATYDFNKNFQAVVDYKINLLDEEDRGAKGVDGNTKDTLSLGLKYQF